jgi:hypothetical protein
MGIAKLRDCFVRDSSFAFIHMSTEIFQSYEERIKGTGKDLLEGVKVPMQDPFGTPFKELFGTNL